MGLIDFNITEQLDSIEKERRKAEDEFNKREIKIYNKFLDFKLNFGKYTGKTIKEVLNIDKQYIYWLLRETYRTGIKINILDLDKIVRYYRNVKNMESYKRESEAKARQVQNLIDDGMSPSVAYNVVHNRNCRDFGM